MNPQFKDVGRLKVFICPTREAMGEYAAGIAVSEMKKMLLHKEELNVVFAAAPSQNEFLASLQREGGVEWNRINAFHMDEYVGLAVGQNGSFTRFLNDAVFDVLPFKNVYRLNGAASDAAQECERYADLLRAHPIDIVFMGVGENGHIAFNDPSVADFQDKAFVKTVKLDDVCRMQQVHDKCFDDIDHVPQHAYTLTIPALLSAKKILCIVPGKTKAPAIARMLMGTIDETCPASILRRHDNAELFLDADSARIWEEGGL